MAIPNKEGCFALFPVLLHGRVLNLPVPPKKKSALRLYKLLCFSQS